MSNKMFNIPRVDISYDKKKPKQLNAINVRSLVTESYNPVSVKPTNPKVKVRFSQDCTKSINLRELRFSNKLPKLDEAALDSYIEKAFMKIKEDNEIIKTFCEPINYSGKHKDRIKSIICKYMEEDDFDLYSGYYWKSDIRTGDLLKERGAFRVISFYQVEPKKHKRQKNSKHYLIVVCIDPYHLFIPSEDYGTTLYSAIKDYSNDIEAKFPLIEIEG